MYVVHMTQSLIKDLNQNEKPREKLLKMGAVSLTDEELVAIVIGSGGKGMSVISLAREAIKTAGSLRNLVDTEIEQLMAIKYMSIAKTCAIKAAVELGLRISMTEKSEKKLITKPEDAYQQVRKILFNDKQEKLALICLNARNKVISIEIVSTGSLNETIVSPRNIFKKALDKNASSIILAHNHPSNELEPSTEDIATTERIFLLGQEMNIPLIDHIIVSDNSFCSLKMLNLINSDYSKRKGGEKKF